MILCNISDTFPHIRQYLIHKVKDLLMEYVHAGGWNSDYQHKPDSLLPRVIVNIFSCSY